MYFQGAVDFDKMKEDPILFEAIREQIRHFGQTPVQVDAGGLWKLIITEKRNIYDNYRAHLNAHVTLTFENLCTDNICICEEQ